MKRVSNFLIDFYFMHFSLFIESKGIHCKYEPTCSEYTRQAINKYGFFKGTFIGLKRILRCNPFSKGGYDPLK